jgi:lipid-A-disaccharide synthase
MRGDPAHFVGHPAFGRAVPSRDLDVESGPMLVLMPGSRDAEMKRNTPVMHQVAAQLVSTVPGLRVCTAAPSSRAASMLRRLTRDPFNLTLGGAIRVGETEALLRRADAALVVSGTATLEAAAHEVPMVAMYQASYLAWQWAGRFLISTRTFTLPNLIAENEGLGRVIPEFVPHFGDPEPLRRALEPLLTNAAAREKQREGLRRLRQPFEGVDFAARAAERLRAHLDAPGGAEGTRAPAQAAAALL